MPARGGVQSDLRNDFSLRDLQVDWSRIANGVLMFRSSVVASYASVPCAFYGADGSVCRDSFLMFHLCPEVKKIVHRMSEILFASKIMFRGLD